jgi:glycosyltransferase involved in cell wall biosynthesis
MQRDNPSIYFFTTHPSGGIRELWSNLAEGFQRDGMPAGLAALYPVQQLADASPNLTWSHLVSGRPTGIIGQLRLLASLARWLRRTRPQAIVTAMPAANVVVPLFARVFSPSTRVIVSHHSPTETHSRAFDMIDSWSGTLSNVAAVVSVSDTVARSLDAKPTRYRAKRKTIHNGLPPSIELALDDLAASRLRDRALGRRLMATGRLAYQKNYPLLLRAVAQLKDVTLDIIGNGPDEAELRALVKDLGIEDRVVFHGYRPREETLALLAQGDVFVQVSRFEGHSLGLLEAARLALPLVVSAIPVQIEAVTGPDGEVRAQSVDLDDVDRLGSICGRLLDSSEDYHHWSTLSGQIARDFTFAAMLAKYHLVIR